MARTSFKFIYKNKNFSLKREVAYLDWCVQEYKTYYDGTIRYRERTQLLGLEPRRFIQHIKKLELVHCWYNYLITNGHIRLDYDLFYAIVTKGRNPQTELYPQVIKQRFGKYQYWNPDYSARNRKYKKKPQHKKKRKNKDRDLWREEKLKDFRNRSWRRKTRTFYKRHSHCVARQFVRQSLHHERYEEISKETTKYTRFIDPWCWD